MRFPPPSPKPKSQTRKKEKQSSCHRAEALLALETGKVRPTQTAQREKRSGESPEAQTRFVVPFSLSSSSPRIPVALMERRPSSFSFIPLASFHSYFRLPLYFSYFPFDFDSRCCLAIANLALRFSARLSFFSAARAACFLFRAAFFSSDVGVGGGQPFAPGFSPQLLGQPFALGCASQSCSCTEERNAFQWAWGFWESRSIFADAKLKRIGTTDRRNMVTIAGETKPMRGGRDEEMRGN